MKKTILVALAAAVLSCAPLSGFELGVAHANIVKGQILSGKASWYGPGFHGRQTANGERFDMNKLTAAHKTLPFGTKVRVTNKANGKSVVVRINDRGPYAHGRIIDLSRGAAKAVGMIGRGVAQVTLEVLV
ncbi:septal ring lytic transglycosylase RlpA family protein [Consotaella aegiceratis]|uniref:septal ring lytic transglycosylase RlpA family protein n=1 Tax=Consotaella aegiceratis TaxID=3097961 RepID=UPI002F401847